MPVMRVERAGAQIGALEYALEKRMPFWAKRSMLGVDA